MPGNTLLPEDTVLLLIQLPAIYTAGGDELDAGLNQTILTAMSPSARLHISNQRLDMSFDAVPAAVGGEGVCAQAGSMHVNATELTVELATALGLPEASVSLACSVRAIDSADAGRRKLQVCVAGRSEATV